MLFDVTKALSDDMAELEHGEVIRLLVNDNDGSAGDGEK